MSKTIIVDGKSVEVPDDYDSTTHQVFTNEDGTYVVQRNDQIQEATPMSTQGGQNGDVSLYSKPVEEQEIQAAQITQPQSRQPQTLTEKDKLTGSGQYLNLLFAHADQDQNDVISTNAGKYKISVFFAPKFIASAEVFTKDQCIFLKYNDTVESVVLEDDIDRIGMKGYIDVINKNSILDTFLGRHNNYYLVITFTQYIDTFLEQKPVLKYQPYIFDIDYVQNLSNPQTEDKKLRIGLVDIITSILKTHSIASVIKFHRQLPNSGSYKKAFKIILDYVKSYIQINTNNKYQLKKDLLYDEDTKCLGNTKDGYDKYASMQELVKASFQKIPRDATILEALGVLTKDCCTTLKAPKSFSDRFATIGDVLIPFFFKEEYPDPMFIYPTIWQKSSQDDKNSDVTTAGSSNLPVTYVGDDEVPPWLAEGDDEIPFWLLDDVIVQGAQDGSQSPPVVTEGQPQQLLQVEEASKSYMDGVRERYNLLVDTVKQYSQKATAQLSGWQNAIKELPNYKNNNMKKMTEFYWSGYHGKAQRLLCRQMTMRNIYMPFFLAFGNKNYSSLMEDINPSRDNADKNDEIPFLGVYHGELKSFQFHPIDINSVKKLWKNVVFLECSNKMIGANSVLIFFSWFFDFFQHVFLNTEESGLLSNVMPDFFMFSRVQGIPHAKESGNKFENLFDQYNSNTYSTVTNDSVGECLRYMGKNLASFTLINDSYTFKMNGNLLRRPNEIVRFGYKGNTSGGLMQMLSSNVGLHFGDHTYLYVRKVIHRFTGNVYNTDVLGYKICELLSPQDGN